MKKRTVLIATLVVLLTLLVSVVPVGAHGGLTLLSAKARYGEAAVFTFKVHKDYGKFKGTAYFYGQAYPLSCNLKASDADILLCRGNGQLAGKYVQVVVNGLSFNTMVVEGAAFCNPVYDLPTGGAGPEWMDYGDYCTGRQPQYDDLVELSGYYPFGTWWYKFKPNGLCTGINDFGDGWYWVPSICGGS